ncbi:MAG TPA: TRAP transporter large permease [Casimicrobiaceae bacterium]|jgi:tripartite ATP-independent transporter DctM subunit|nr:TRAP transporter large permease [Casimicrobiaceae bacterium]
MDGFIVVFSFLVLFVLGFPVVLAIGLPCVVYILAKGLPIDLVAQRTLYALDSFPLVAVPVFLFVGSLMNSAGISRYIYQFADTAVGRMPGGLAQVNIFGSLIFAGMSGSALADIGGLGRIEIDAMKKKGFSPAFAAAVTSSSAIVGPIFPPSIPLIIYGTVTGVSVIQLLLGGILPGLVCVAMLMLMTGWLAVRRRYPRAARWPTSKELWRDFKPAFPAIAAPVILIVGMLLGYFTPTEIASVTVLYAILISSLFYRELTVKGLLDAAFETIRASAGILLIVAVAALFGWILSVEQVPQLLTGWMLGISTNPYVLLMIVNLLLIVVGMFLDSTTAILVIAPIIAKPLVMAGVDPVHLGMVVVFNLMIGLLTPPMGLALFLVGDIAKVSMKDVLREMAPYYIPLVATLLAITYIPGITTWIPNWALGN